MARGIHAVRDDRVVLDVRLGRHGLEKHFFQGLGRVVADHDAVAVAAFFFGAGGGLCTRRQVPGARTSGMLA